MAQYRILVDFMGSQDGRFADAFKAGTQADLSDYLVSCLPAASIQRIEPVADPAVGKRRKTAGADVSTTKVGAGDAAPAVPSEGVAA